MDAFLPLERSVTSNWPKISWTPLKSRGFAHFDLLTSENQWKRLVSAYNGSSWRGGKLRIEVARPDYLQRSLSSCSPIVPTKRIRHLVRHSNCGLMTDAQVEQRRGWKRGRYGRALAMVRIRRPDGEVVTVDPAHYKDRITKLFGSVKPLPITKLTWFIENVDKVESDNSKSESEEKSGSDNFKSEGEEKVGSDNFNVDGYDEVIERPDDTITEIEEDVVEFTPITEESSVESLQVPNNEKAFSLANLLGLQPEVIKTDTNADLVKITTNSTIETSEAILESRTRRTVPISELLFDMSKLEVMPLQEYAFCRRSGKEEAYLLWKEGRKELRADFKQRIKQAKKLARRKLAHELIDLTTDQYENVIAIKLNLLKRYVRFSKLNRIAATIPPRHGAFAGSEFESTQTSIIRSTSL